MLPCLISYIFLKIAVNSTMIVQSRGGSRTAATSKVELFVIIVNGFQPVTINTKNSTLDVVAVLDLPLQIVKS